jgi:hypothetical protein
MPKSYLGKLSLALIAVFFSLYALFYSFIVLGERGGVTYFSNLKLALPITLAAISAISAFFTGMTAIIKRKERSVFVFLATIIGFFVLFFVLGEIIFPH